MANAVHFTDPFAKLIAHWARVWRQGREFRQKRALSQKLNETVNEPSISRYRATVVLVCRARTRAGVIGVSLMLKRFMSGAAISALSMLATAPVAFSQETTSAVRGEVLTESGAAIANATVTITHVPSGTRTQTRTNEAGVFDARGLRVGGPYSIEFAAQDYRSERVEDLFLSLGDPARLTVDLADEGGDIVVVAQRRVLGGAVGSETTLRRDDIDAVVSVNRDIRDLARRDPLVSQTAGGNQGIRIAGSNPRTNRIAIDGVQAQDDFGLNTGGLPTRRGPVSLDAIEAFQVEAVPFDVENGDFLGGAINVVLAQGTNDLSGSAFVNYLNEGLVGQQIAGSENRRLVTQENWGGTLRGPIVKDTLFYALSYENYESVDVTSVGPAGQSFANTVPGPGGLAITQAQIDTITNIFRNTYGSTRDPGRVTLTKPVTDEKMTARIDWNISDKHRAFATYRYSESGLIQRTNLSTGATNSMGLDSQWYLTGEEDQTFAFQVNSNWTDRFSTEMRYSQRDYNRLQEPPGGQNFADISVCLDATSTGSLTNCGSVGVVRFGPDNNRHANFLQTQNQQAQISGDYAFDRHALKFGVSWQRTDVFNIFLPNSDGVYYFDSIADFTAGRANQYTYRNALTNNATDAAAAFDYHIWSAFIQDAWDVTDDLTVTAGVRYDTYTSDKKPIFNPNFRNRFGFSNQETYDGRDVIMPRLAAEWRATDDLKISGGIGLFSGGIPDVFISNSFANTGFIDNSFTFQRTSTTGFAATETNGNINCAVTPAPAACVDALNVPVNSAFGASVPASVRAALAGLTASPFGETNSIARDFEIPSDWRANISAKYNRFGFDWGFDAIYVTTNEGIAFRDLRATPLLINGQRARTPDGRLRYDGLRTVQRTSIAGTTISAPPSNIPVATNGEIGGSRDIQAYNPSESSDYLTLAFSVAREWENGLNFGLSYTFQDFNEFSSSARFASTANSFYNDQFYGVDPNLPTKGEGLEEIRNTWKGQLGWRKAFVGELETRFDLFGTWTEDRASSPTMRGLSVTNGTNGRSSAFGVGVNNAILAYIPAVNDPLVAYDSATTQTNLDTLIARLGLARGAIAQRGSIANDDIARFDLNISQELPGLHEGHKSVLSFQIQNFGNLLNDEWGIIRTRNETGVRLFDVQCAGSDGVADNDGIASCNRYLISNVNTSGANETLDSETSRWYIQVGLKYQF